MTMTSYSLPCHFFKEDSGTNEVVGAGREGCGTDLGTVLRRRLAEADAVSSLSPALSWPCSYRSSQ